MADDVAVEALAALQTAVTSLLPAAPGGLAHNLRVQAQTVRPLGLGGYVGRHVAPDASISARRVSARVDVGVTGGGDAEAAGHAAALAGQILAQTRTDFAQRGISRIRGIGAADPRGLAFDIDFDYVRIPSAGEGLIAELVLDAELNDTPYRAPLLAEFAAASLATAALPLADFTPLTDPGAAPPAAWALDAGPPAAVVQTAASSGGPGTTAGAQLLWRPRGAALALARLSIAIDVAAGATGAVGVVLHRRAGDDYLYYAAEPGAGRQRFGRRTPAGWQTLGEAAAPFAPAVQHRLVVTSYDGVLTADVDGTRTLTAQAAPPAAGEVSLLTQGTAAARFSAARLRRLD